jgi:hypothetical protein
MASAYSGQIGFEISLAGGSTYAVHDALGTDRPAITTRYRKVVLPAPHGIDFQAELGAMRGVFRELHETERFLIDIAVGEAEHQLRRCQPDVDKIGTALQRALDLASRAEDFDEKADELAPHLTRACVWLGGRWYRLLGFVGLTA